MRKDPWRVLLCSAGRRVGLLNSFRSAADRLGRSLEIIACDLVPELSAACSFADTAFAAPRCDDPGYAEAVLEIARRHGAQLVVPTIDPELLPLAQATQDFIEAGIRLHVSDLATIETARDKARTSEVLGAAGVPVPRTLSHADLMANPQRLRWPVFAKPKGGSASRGLQLIERPEDLPTQFDEPMIFQDFHQGPEFTVNIFVDAEGRLCAVVPHRRIRIRAGEVEKGITVRRADLHDIALRVVAALPGLRGVACFQVLDDPKEGPKVIEINARFGGGYPLADHAGASFAQWLLEEVNGLSVSAHDDWRENVLMLRYDCAVFRG
jgi:carbamoyl-phosphate synthase large subunit